MKKSRKDKIKKMKHLNRIECAKSKRLPKLKVIYSDNNTTLYEQETI